MDWSAEGILLSVKRHGESSAIIETLTAEHGRHAGLVRGGSGRRHGAILQPGNQLSLTWRARLADHLGIFTTEVVRSRAADALADREALAILDSLRALACAFLPEREPVPTVYAATESVLDSLPDPDARRRAYALWEIVLLAELGFGLSLGACVATGRTDDLIYVSPKSGRAVSREAGAPYAAKMLPLPGFLNDPVEGPSRLAFVDSLRMTGFFLDRWAGQSLGLSAPPPARGRLISVLSA